MIILESSIQDRASRIRSYGSFKSSTGLILPEKIRSLNQVTIVKMLPITKDRLEALYRKYNRREFVHPDPLEFLYSFEKLCDREIVALVASSLAYGKVAQILKSVSCVLEQMMPSPSVFIKRASLETIQQTFSGFKHRFTTGQHLSFMLFGVKKVLINYGSLHACFLTGLNDDDTVLPALTSFTDEL